MGDFEAEFAAVSARFADVSWTIQKHKAAVAATLCFKSQKIFSSRRGELCAMPRVSRWVITRYPRVKA